MRRLLLLPTIFTLVPAITLLCSALVCFAVLSGLLVRRCVITHERWGACQVSIGVHVCSAAGVTRGVAKWRSGGGESGVRAWPKLGVAGLQRGSDAQVSLTR